MTKKGLTFKQFWELSEVYTAPLNLFIILLGISAAHYLGGATLSINLTVFTCIIISFHVAVNIFNHWQDYNNAQDEHYKTVTNIIGRDNLSLKTVKGYFYSAMIISFVLGAYLVSQTNLFVGLLGGIGFYIGLFYSYGKYPLNSLPIAETITAIASGFFITLISYYLATYTESQSLAHFMTKLAGISLPLVISMFNNLLANNICDLEEDIPNGRKTLVYYLGKPRAVSLLLFLSVFNYLWLIVLVFLQLAPVTVLLLLLALPFVLKSLKVFKHKQDKQTTFPIILKTMSLTMVLYPILYFLGSYL